MITANCTLFIKFLCTFVYVTGIHSNNLIDECFLVPMHCHSITMRRNIKAFNQEKFFLRVEKFSKIIFQVMGFNLIPLPGHKMNYILLKFYLKLWACILLFIIVISAGIGVNFHDVLLTDSYVGKANDGLKFATVFLAYSVSLFETIIHQKMYEKIQRKLQKFEKVCSVLKVNFPKYYRRLRVNYGRKFLIMFFISISMEVVIISSIGFSRQWQNFWLFNLIPVLSCRVRILQYFYYVNLVNLQVEVLIDELEGIVNFTYWNVTSTHVPEIVNLVQTLKNAYRILHKTVCIINDINAFSLATLIIHEYVQSGCDYYWMHTAFSEYYREDAHIAVILSASIPLLFIYFCLSEAERVEIRGSKIPVLLHSIRKNKNDFKLFKLIHHFSLQIHQEKIKFRASSLFDVNVRLFVSIINALLSYLVIFIQFSSIPTDKRGGNVADEYTFSVKNPLFNF
ncbi:putative gustatory receptor 39b [Chironomus tepperi]|uniref:putative gustatory receptor 39b n=1 Tax=Chironomus tepperi TaxID=113505 RepID=UPI00391F3EF4